MILWPILFITLAFADEEYSVEEYCFSSPAKMRVANQKSKIIFVPSDVVSEQGCCLTVKSRPHRRELIQNFIRNVEPELEIKFSSADNKQPPCELKVEKIKLFNGQTQRTTESKDISAITTQSEFVLSVNQDNIKGICRYLTPERYEITIEVRQEPVLTSTQTNTSPPPDQETSRLVTTVQIEKGQRIELGNIVNNLKNNSNDADLGTNQETVYLSLP